MAILRIFNGLVIMFIFQIVLIALGGFLFSLIPGEGVQFECDDDDENESQRKINKTKLQQNYFTESNNDTSNQTLLLSFSDSMYFVVTTITSIVSFVGIPLNIALLAKIGDALKTASAKLMKPLRKHVKDEKRFIKLQIFASILIGTVLFILIPSFIIELIEDWKYLDAIYYAFITVFTIGFGDLVAGYCSKMNPTWNFIYRIILYIWMFLGMAYMALIINLFVEYFKNNADALKKEINEIISEKLGNSIKEFLKNNKSAKQPKFQRSQSLPAAVIKNPKLLKTNSKNVLDKRHSLTSLNKLNFSVKGDYEKIYEAALQRIKMKKKQNKRVSYAKDQSEANEDFYSVTSLNENYGSKYNSIYEDCLQIDINRSNNKNNVFENNIYQQQSRPRCDSAFHEIYEIVNTPKLKSFDNPLYFEFDESDDSTKL